MRYPAVLHKDDNGYGVIVPDLPGCFSAGDSIDEAMDGAKEAIEAHIEGLMLDGDAIPVATTVDAYRNDPNYADADCWAVIEVNPAKLSSKTVRINITVPERVLPAIDAAAKKKGESRSGFFVESALAHLG